MGEFIGILVVGVIAGWLAGVVTRTNRGILDDLLLGVLGAIIGFLIFGASDSLLPSILIATVGAVILVIGKNLIMGRRAA